MSNLLQYKVTTFTTPLTIHNRNITVLNKVPVQSWQLYNGVVLCYSSVWCEAKLIFVESGNKLYKLAARHKIGQWLSLSDFKTLCDYCSFTIFDRDTEVIALNVMTNTS